MKRPLCHAFLSLCFIQNGLATVVLRYDEPKPYLSPIAAAPNTSVLIPYYDEAGFRTKALGSIPSQPPYNNIALVGPNSDAASARPNNGSPHMAILNSGSIEIFSLQGLPFRADSIDLAEYSTVFQQPKSIMFEGVLDGGGSVFTTFTTDGIINGGLSIGDFETFHFPASFTNLVFLRSRTTIYSFDNVTLTVIPEPAPLALIGLTVIGGFCLRRGRHGARGHI